MWTAKHIFAGLQHLIAVHSHANSKTSSGRRLCGRCSCWAKGLASPTAEGSASRQQGCVQSTFVTTEKLISATSESFHMYAYQDIRTTCLEKACLIKMDHGSNCS